MTKVTTAFDLGHHLDSRILTLWIYWRRELPPRSKSMKTTKFSGVAVALSSLCLFSSSTSAYAQNTPRIVIPKTCSREYINRGAVSNDPSNAVMKALIAWNRLSNQKGFLNFKASKKPKVKVVIYPSNNASEVIWKANVIAFPCKFLDFGRR